MKYNIRGQRMEVTDALREYVEKKLSRLDKYFETPPQSDVNVTLSVTKGHQAIEVMIPLPGAMLRAEEKRDDMYASIDFVVDKLERQIRKHKTKINRKFREPGSARALFKEDFGNGSVSTLAREEARSDQALQPEADGRRGSDSADESRRTQLLRVREYRHEGSECRLPSGRRQIRAD